MSSIKGVLDKEGVNAKNIYSYYVTTSYSSVVKSNIKTNNSNDSNRNSQTDDQIKPKNVVTKSEAAPKPLKTPTKHTKSRSSISNSPSVEYTNEDRIWYYTFRQTNRAIDELYYLCEHESNIVQCQQAKIVLTSAVNDFDKLIESLKTQITQESTQGKSCVAWEIPKRIPSIQPSEIPYLSEKEGEPIPIDMDMSGRDSTSSSFSPKRYSFTGSLSSPGSSIQKKFENRKYVSPERSIEKQLEKQKTAEKNREALENQRNEKLKITDQKIDEINLKRNKQTQEKAQKYQNKIESAGNRRDQNIESIREKARKENSKIPESGELEFFDQQNNNLKKATIINKLEESEERRKKILNEKVNRAKLVGEKDESTSPHSRKQFSTLIIPKMICIDSNNLTKLQQEVKKLKSKSKRIKKSIISKEIKWEEDNESNNQKLKYNTLATEIDKLYASNPLDCQVTKLDTILKIIIKTIQIDPAIFLSIRSCNIVEKLLKFLNQIYLEKNLSLAYSVIKVLNKILTNDIKTCEYVVSNDIFITFLNLTMWGISTTIDDLDVLCYIILILRTLYKIDTNNNNNKNNDDNNNLLKDRLLLGIEYLCSCGFMRYISSRFEVWRECLPITMDYACLLQNCIGLLEIWTQLSIPNEFKLDNKSSQLTLFNELRATNISNLMSLMLSWIMKAAPPPSNKSIIHTLPENVIIVTTTGLKVLNNIAIQEISLFQNEVGSTGMSVEYQHSIRFLMTHLLELWKSEKIDKDSENLFALLLINQGYMMVGNPLTQQMFNWGLPPTIAQQMCQIPIKYFIDNKYKSSLFPTFLSLVYKNESNNILLFEQFDPHFLIDYLEELKRNPDFERNIPEWMYCENRFPREWWDDAIQQLKNYTE